ncbi:MAG TPA: 50S ribosomal protein L14e [Candidatus Nanoarchaeia archaeon]|nr:50S ribosomal protein L14e [Candidatus Nanoarchaeia archaeon]
MEIGRLCVKIAGRDAGLRCVVLDLLDKNLVLIDGETRRRKCNAAHLEPLGQKIEIEKNASHDEVVAAFKALGIEVIAKKSKAKAPAQGKALATTPEVTPKVAATPAKE